MSELKVNLSFVGPAKINILIDFDPVSKPSDTMVSVPTAPVDPALADPALADPAPADPALADPAPADLALAEPANVIDEIEMPSSTVSDSPYFENISEFDETDFDAVPLSIDWNDLVLEY